MELLHIARIIVGVAARGTIRMIFRVILGRVDVDARLELSSDERG
jgi:hypothetical protein